MKKALRNSALKVSLLTKARVSSGYSFSHMMSQAYSFEAKSMVTIMTEAQLIDLIEERRARGMSEEQLADFENWHRAALNRPPATE